MNTNTRRVLAHLLAIAMLLSVVPFPAMTVEDNIFAAEDAIVETCTHDHTLGVQDVITEEAAVARHKGSTATAASSTHKHCVCGTSHTNIGDHVAEQSITWQAWDGKDDISYTDNAAYIYLSGNVTLDSAIAVSSGQTLYLCLNGHTISPSNSYTNGLAVSVANSATFILTDCGTQGAITGFAHAYNTSSAQGGGVYNTGDFAMYGGRIHDNAGELGGGVYNAGTFTMYGGRIFENRTDGKNTTNQSEKRHGGGVYSSGTFTMNGGTISKNDANSNGGGVYNSGTFTITGGTISENTASAYGGSVYNSGTFTMSGGTISENAADDGGGGVYNTNTFTMSGGTICDNYINSNAFSSTYYNGGGVYNDGTFTMSGGAICENTATNQGGGIFNRGTVNLSGTVDISKNTVWTLSATKIGQDIYQSNKSYTPSITVADALTTPDTPMLIKMDVIGTFTSGWSTYMAGRNYNDYLTSANSQYAVTLKNGELTLVEAATLPALHTHCVCGNATELPDSHDCNDTTVWEAWTSTDSLPTTAGYYYLAVDVTLSAAWEPADGTVLCMNGHYIKQGASEASVIDINSGRSFTLTDCSIVTHKFTKTEDGTWQYDPTNGTETVTGGFITGGNSGSGVSNDGTFTMYGGNIVGNAAPAEGGGVYTHGTFTMYDGTISGNTAEYDGGGVFNNGTFTMYGGTISGNTASRNGGGVFNCYDGSTFTMDGGTISENTADSRGGGVYNGDKATFTMFSGNIVSNTADVSSGVENNGTFTMNGGEIRGNIASTYNGGVGNGGIFTMNGGSISQNNGGIFGGGVSNGKGTFKMNGGTISGNTADIDGGGVNNTNSGTFMMTGGRISGNAGEDVTIGATFTMSSGTIGTLEIRYDGHLNLFGTPKILDKLYLDSNNVITITGSITIDSPIPVSMWTPGVFTSGWSDYMGDADYSKYFAAADSQQYIVTKQGDELALVSATTYGITSASTTHGSFTVSASNSYSGQTITVTPTADPHYKVGSVTYNDGTDHILTPDNGVYSFTMPAANVTVTVVFVLDENAHTGGSATCTAQAVCSVCSQPYGSTLPHDYTAETQKAEALKTAGNCRDEAVYYYSCSACGLVESDDDHTFEGSKDADNHVGGTELVNQSDANHKTQVDGYTGDTKCLGCGNIIDYGQTIAAGAHVPANTWTTDGTYHWKVCTVENCGVVIESTKVEHNSTGANVATCQNAAVCDDCGESYGTVALHDYTAETKKQEALKSEGNCRDESVYYYSCSVCGSVESDDSHTFLGDKIADAHVGGTTTVNASAADHKTQTDGYTGDTKCLGCGNIIGYGQPIAAGAHVPADTWTTDGTYHWKVCTVENCGIMIDSTKAEHSATGTNVATCKTKAVCDACGTEHGALNENHHVGETTIVNASAADHKTQTNGYTGDTKCLDCNEIISYGQTIAAGAHVPANTWTTDETHHWKVCTVENCGIVIDGSKAEHSSTGANVATCQKAAVCDDCGVSYGTVADHDWNTSAWEKDASGHWYKCNTSGCTEKNSFTEHTYDQMVAEDAFLKAGVTCTTKATYHKSCVCGAFDVNGETFEVGAEPSHDFSTRYTSDATGHWFACANCDAKKDFAAHTPGPAATEYSAQVCTVCRYVIVPAYGHTHRYGSAWVSDDQSHWQECVGCGQMKNEAEHQYSSLGDTECDVCGYERELSTAESCQKDENCHLKTFEDLDAGKWYHDGIHFCIENGLMNGMSDDEFAPNLPTSRAMVITILWRLEGEPTVDYAMNFADVADGKWYTEAIRWAASVGITEGYGDGKFGTNDAVTREQMATILYRYCKFKGYDTSIDNADALDSFVDAQTVSSWAEEAMSWAGSEKLFIGVGNNTLAPKLDATRAEVATLLYRFATSWEN